MIDLVWYIALAVKQNEPETMVFRVAEIAVCSDIVCFLDIALVNPNSSSF